MPVLFYYITSLRVFKCCISQLNVSNEAPYRKSFNQVYNGTYKYLRHKCAFVLNIVGYRAFELRSIFYLSVQCVKVQKLFLIGIIIVFTRLFTVLILNLKGLI